MKTARAYPVFIAACRNLPKEKAYAAMNHTAYLNARCGIGVVES